MSIDFTGFWNRNTSVTNNTAVPAKAEPAANAPSDAKGAQQPALTPGSTIHGQVVKTDGDMATIKLPDNTTIDAKVESGVSLSANSNVYFEVGSVSKDGQIMLRSLFQNTAMGETAKSALTQAGISPSVNALGMVGAMMENGMPIDKQSLLAMYRQVSAHPEISGANVVSMNRLQLPLTDANINQFQAYLNLEHQISEGVSQITDSTLALLDGLAQSGEDASLFAVAEKLLEVFSDFEGSAEAMQGAEGSAALQAEAQETLDEAAVQSTSSDGQGVPAAGMTEQMNGAQAMAEAEQMASAGSLVSPEELLKDPVMKLLAQAFEIDVDAEKLAEGNNGQIDRNPAGRLLSGMTDQTAGPSKEEKADSAGADFARLETALKENGISEESIRGLADPQGRDKAVLEIAKALEQKLGSQTEGALADSLKKLLGSEDFKGALKNQIAKQWMLEPEKVADKKEVESFYEKLREQTGNLAKALSQTVGESQNLFKEVSNMRDNVDFMHQLNQTMSYVQLPLKLAGDNAHGDLYVYTNKKNFAKDDGNVSAFLRLDMEHLGPVDVYIAMQSQNVTTNFYLRDDEIIDLISENISILNERLEKQGYHMNATITQKEEPAGVMQEIIEDHKDNLLIGTKSFDVRA